MQPVALSKLMAKKGEAKQNKNTDGFTEKCKVRKERCLYSVGYLYQSCCSQNSIAYYVNMC